MTALSFGLIASILRIVSSITSSGAICLVRTSSANPTASYDDRPEAGAAIDIFGTRPARVSPIPIVKAKLDDDILKMSRRLKRMGHLPGEERTSAARAATNTNDPKPTCAAPTVRLFVVYAYAAILLVDAAAHLPG